MIVPDVNVLIHAYNSTSGLHERAKAWWEETLNSPTEVGLPWVSALGFIRITTHSRFALHPLTPTEAVRHVRTWLSLPRVRILTPGDRHAEILFALLEKVGVAGNLTTDAHLAALAMEYRAELVSTDTDFARFPGLRWRRLL